MQLEVHQTYGRGVADSIIVWGVVCCDLEQVTFPHLNMYIPGFALAVAIVAICEDFYFLAPKI